MSHKRTARAGSQALCFAFDSVTFGWLFLIFSRGVRIFYVGTARFVKRNGPPISGSTARVVLDCSPPPPPAPSPILVALRLCRNDEHLRFGLHLLLFTLCRVLGVHL